MASTRTTLITACSGASGASAAFTRSLCAGSWALHFPGNLRTANRAGSLEAAKKEFEECWRKWKAWAKLKRWTDGTPPPSMRSNIEIYWNKVETAPRGGDRTSSRHGWCRSRLSTAKSVQAYERRVGQGCLGQAPGSATDLLEAVCGDSSEKENMGANSGSQPPPRPGRKSSREKRIGRGLTLRLPFRQHYGAMQLARCGHGLFDCACERCNCQRRACRHLFYGLACLGKL
jgi:hypothetical protein